MCLPGLTVAARETRIIANRPAVVIDSLPGPSFDHLFPVTVRVYDPGTEATYEIRGLYGDLRDSNADSVIAIAPSLFEPESQP